MQKNCKHYVNMMFLRTFSLFDGQNYIQFKSKMNSITKTNPKYFQIIVWIK